MASEQLMVIDNQTPQLVVDQSQIAYCNPSSSQQQIYYMEEVSRGQQTQVSPEKMHQPETVILNRHMQQMAQGQVVVNSGAEKIVQQSRPTQQQAQTVRQTLQQVKTTKLKLSLNKWSV